MYIPKQYQITDREKTRGFIDHHPFATLVTETPEGPFAPHLPFIFNEESDALILYSHMSLENSQWKHFNEAES